MLSIVSCKEPDSIGLNVLPTSDLTSLSTLDTFTLVTKVVKEDSLLSTGNSVNMLGELNDNGGFGYAGASFYAKVFLKDNNAVSFGISPQFDSLVLTLDYAGYYGDTSCTHNITVYQLQDSIASDSLYYSNKTFALGSVIGTLTTSEIHPNDSILISGVNTDPHLRITLDPVFGNSLMQGFADNAAFTSFLKGIYVKDVVPCTGNILYFNLTEAMSKLSLFYNDTVYDFSLSSPNRINHFEHDYSTAVFGNVFPVAADNLAYIQSMAGVKTKIEIPFIKSLNADSNIIVNKAELIVTLDNSSIVTFPANTSLFLVGIDSLGKSYFTPDYIDSQTAFGGTLTSGTYTFLLTRYIQQILAGSRSNNGMYLVSPGASVNAYRTIVGGGANPNPSSKMKLRITYTHLNP